MFDVFDRPTEAGLALVQFFAHERELLQLTSRPNFNVQLLCHKQFSVQERKITGAPIRTFEARRYVRPIPEACQQSISFVSLQELGVYRLGEEISRYEISYSSSSAARGKHQYDETRLQNRDKDFTWLIISCNPRPKSTAVVA